MMLILARGTPKPAGASPQRHAQSGFTLLELLLVMTVAGFSLAFAVLALPSAADRRLREDAQRLSAIMHEAHQQALAGRQPLVLEMHRAGYRFLRQDATGGEMSAMAGALRERPFASGDIALTFNGLPPSGPTLLIPFGREPIGEPFSLRMAVAGAAVTLQANGLGRFSID